MTQGRKTSIRIILTFEEKTILESWLCSNEIPDPMVRRARIILMLEAGESILETARQVKINDKGVYRWAYRFIEKRIDGLRDNPRTGRRPADSPPKTKGPFR